MFHLQHFLRRQCHTVGKNHTIKTFHMCLQQWTQKVAVSHHFYPLQFVDRFNCVTVTWTGYSVLHRSLTSDSGSKPPTWWQIEIIDEDNLKDEDGVEEVATSPHCGEGFANESALQEHIDKTDKLKRGGCKRNKNDVLAGKKRHICEICEKGFDFLSQLRLHLLIHGESKHFKCPECDKTYKHKASLNNHLKFYHSNEKRYACPKCKKTFRVKSVMLRHLRTVCNSEAKKYECEVKKIAICPHCGKGFANESALQEHIDKTYKRKNGGCNVLRKSKIKEELNIQDKRYKCDVCGQGFDFKSGLIKHRLSHSNARNFKCEECGKLYKTEKILKHHLKNSHSSETKSAYDPVNRPYQCEDCGNSFKTPQSLNYHRIRKHTFEFSLYCQVCSEQGVKKGFVTPAELKKHMVAQHPREYLDQLETELPAACNKCSKRFSTMQQLNDHYRKVHGLST